MLIMVFGYMNTVSLSIKLKKGGLYETDEKIEFPIIIK